MRAIKTTTISILAIGLLAGSAVGVAAQDEEAAAGVTSFTYTLGPGDCEVGAPTDTDLPNGFTETTGFTCLGSYESSDSRFTGDVSAVTNWVVGPDGFSAWETGGQANMLRSNTVVLTNDDGSWLGEGTAFSSTDLDVNSETFIFVGQEGYEGLTAYVISESTPGPPTFSGVIFPTAMPEVPEPYTAE